MSLTQSMCPHRKKFRVNYTGEKESGYYIYCDDCGLKILETTASTQEPCIALFGTLATGFKAIGPFPSYRDAFEFAEKDHSLRTQPLSVIDLEILTDLEGA